MAFIRAVVMAPFLHVYFPWLAARAPGTSLASVAKRVAIDQAVGAPVSISLVFAAASLLRGEPAAFPERVREQLPATWVAGAS
jgi:hypothetical protein